MNKTCLSTLLNTLHIHSGHSSLTYWNCNCNSPEEGSLPTRPYCIVDNCRLETLLDIVATVWKVQSGCVHSKFCTMVWGFYLMLVKRFRADLLSFWLLALLKYKESEDGDEMMMKIGIRMKVGNHDED